LTADLRTNCLIAGGLALKATPRAVELVSFLVDRYPRWTPFDDLFSGVLGEQATSRNQIQHALKTSRLSLGKLGWAIENEPSRGYRIKRAELSAPPLSPSISAQYSEGSMMTVDPAGPPSAT
jgi:DNA-binding winged helix-turn-helix (wHTH) protein